MKKIDLTKGNVLSVLTTLALPIMGSSFLQFAYGLIDMFWVGGLGSSAVASIGSSSFFLGLGYSINALVVTGTGIKVSHEVGRKNEIETEDYIRNEFSYRTNICISISGFWKRINRIFKFK